MNSNVHGRPPAVLRCRVASSARAVRQLAFLPCLSAEPSSPVLSTHSLSILPLPLFSASPCQRHGRVGKTPLLLMFLSLSSSFLQLQPPSPPHPLCLTAVAPSPRAAGAAGNTATSKVAAAAAGAHGQEAVVRCWPGRDLARVRPDVAKRQHGFPGAPSPLHRRRRAASGRNHELPDDLPAVIRVRDLVLKFEEREGPNCIVCDSYE